MPQSVCEPMDLDVPENDDEVPIIESANLDLDSHISHYRGVQRIQRLEFIAEHCKSLRTEALLQAINYIKENTHNVKDYQRLFNNLKDSGFTNATLDVDWIESTSRVSACRLERLNSDIKSYRSSCIKENVRRCQNDLAEHWLDCGELELAFNCYSKSREFIDSHKHQINLCLNMIRIGILSNQWSAVINHISKAQALPNYDVSNNPNLSTSLHCAAGLFELTSRNYRKAAKHFLCTNLDNFDRQLNRPSPNNLSQPTAGPSHALDTSTMRDCQVLAPINIAVYGSICALATFSRQELSQRLINSQTFKQFAELDPQTRELVFYFHEFKYAACLSILQDIKSNLLLDLYLGRHVERLYSMIKNKALVQYFEPYSSVSMHKMARDFNTSVVELEREIINLIYEGHIKARIDSHNKILYAKKPDTRTMTFERSLKFGKLWQKQTRALITRAAIMNAELMVTGQNMPDKAGSSRSLI